MFCMMFGAPHIIGILRIVVDLEFPRLPTTAILSDHKNKAFAFFNGDRRMCFRPRRQDFYGYTDLVHVLFLIISASLRHEAQSGEYPSKGGLSFFEGSTNP